MSTYVEITRHFRDADKEAVPSDVRRLMRSLSSRKVITWKELLEGDQGKPIVLVAPSLFGKTSEFEHRVRQLRSSGSHAVYCQAGAIVDGFEAGLSAEEGRAYQRWSEVSVRSPASMHCPQAFATASCRRTQDADESRGVA